MRDHRGEIDPYGNELHVTQMAVVDELAGAGELVKGKCDQVPVAVVRGYPGLRGDEPDGPGVGRADPRRRARTCSRSAPPRRARPACATPRRLPDVGAARAGDRRPTPAAVARAIATVAGGSRRARAHADAPAGTRARDRR